MRKHLNDYLFSPLSWLLAFIVIVLLIAVLLFTTPMGVKLVASVADASLKELTIKGISGTLLSGLHIDEIIWDDGDSIALKNVDLKIQHYDTHRKRLVAQTVKAERLTINIATTGTGGDITSLPDFGLPLNMNAHLVQLDSLRITENVPDDPEAQNLLFQVRNIQLRKVTIRDGLLFFRKLEGKPIIMDQPLQLSLKEGRLNMNQPHDIKTEGSLVYKHPDLGDVDGEIQLSGTLTDYRFEGQVNHQQKTLGKQVITLKGQGNYKRVHLEQVTLNSAHGEVEAKGRVLWDPEVTWAFLINGKDLSTRKFLPDWPATIDAEVRYSGSYIDSRLENNFNILSIAGKLREYDVNLTGGVKVREGVVITDDLNLILGDNQLQLDGRANEPFNLKWKIDANNVKPLLPKQYKDLNIGGLLKGSGILKGRINKPEIKLDVIANDLQYKEFKQGKEALHIKGEVGLVDKQLVLKDLSLVSGVNRLKASGKASEPFDLNWSIDAKSLKQFSPQLAGEIKGSGLVRGDLKKSELALKLAVNNFAYKEIRQGAETFFLEGQLGIQLDKNNSPTIQLKELLAKSGKNTVQVTGQASEPMNLKLTINAQNLSQISPDLGGHIQGNGQVLGNYNEPVMKANLKMANLRYKETRFAQKELAIRGEIQLLDGIPMIKELNSSVGNNHVQISGRASSPYDLSWNIDSKNLQQLMPELSGQLAAKGRLKGTLENPIINATADAKKLRFRDFKLASAGLVATTKNGVYDIKGNFKKLEGGGQKISKASLDVRGRVENHTIKLAFDHKEGKVKLSASGAWLKQTWKGSLQRLTLKNTQAGDWRLQKPTALMLSKTSINVNQFCLSSKNTSVCSTLDWSKQRGLSTKGSLNKTPIALLQPWLPEGVIFDGSVSGRYDIQQNNGKPKGSVKLVLPNSHFSFKNEEGDEQTFAYKDAELTATINDRTVKTKARMNIVNRGKFSADAIIKLSPENGRHTINGSAQFDVPNINWAQDFIPHSRGLRGAFKSKLSISGLLKKPKIIGNASLKNGYLRLPEAGTELTNINVSMHADRPGQAVLTGRMFMGKGAINVSGNLDIRDVVNWKANVKLKGKNLRFMNTNEIKATMSPDLDISLTPKTVDITGKVLIPEAFINLKEIPETSVDESEDAYVIGEKKPGDRVSAVRVRPNVIIQLGDKVRLNAFGLRAKLSGEIKIAHNQRDIITNGSLRVTDGKYQAYGQDLNINNGRLIFNGSPKQIGMDIRATRKVDNTTVGIHLGGTLRSPKSKIFSEPPLPESEALSFLITGHSLSTASGQESALLMSAVRGLGISGDDGLIRKIGASLGLDDVNIVTSEDIKKSKLQLGKRLGSRLYVRYLIGLFDQAQKITIEYKINKFLSLEAETTVDNYGLDFIYEIDRD